MISGNVINQAVPYLSNNNSSFTPIDVSLNIQAGRYVASGSTITSGRDYYFAFDNTTTTFWLSSSSINTYNTPDGSYNGITNTYTTSGSYIYGEYIQISLPYSFILRNARIYQFTDVNYNSKIISIVGSNDNINWNESFLTVNINVTGFTDVSFQTNIVSYSSYRFIVKSTNNIGVGPLPVAITKIDLSGIVQNTTGSYSASLAASGTGKYVALANQGYNYNTGNLYTSSDFGLTYSDTNAKANGNGSWQSLSVSQTGQYQYATICMTTSQGNIWKSADYGATWSDTNFGKQNGWQSIQVSSTGQYVSAIQAGNTTSGKGNIWTSSDYGATWSSSQQIYSFLLFNNGYLNQGTTDFNKTIAMSTNGKFQTALALGSSSNSASGNANIWISNNYGQGSWIDTGYAAPVVSGNVSILSSVSMTATGQFQTIAYISGNSLVRSTVRGNVLTSTDYGVSWKDVAFKPPATTTNGNTYYGYLSKVATSVNGKYTSAISKYQDISANTYNNNNSTAINVGNLYSSIMPSLNQLLTTQYLGSSYTGNIFQTHGFKMTVPTVNQSSIVMGYDVNMDTGYINSADQNGLNALSINAAGVGIGKLNQPQYALDVSGVVGITNDKGVILMQANTANNMGLGQNVLNGLTTGAQNTAIGYNALTADTTGSNNTALGFNAFSNATNLIQSTAIGYNAQPTTSNQIVLGTVTESVFVPGTTAAYNINSGALQVGGGGGIGGNLFVGGNLSAVNDVSFGNNLYIAGAMYIKGLKVESNTGPTGRTGCTGPTGSTGPTGPTGPVGPGVIAAYAQGYMTSAQTNMNSSESGDGTYIVQFNSVPTLFGPDIVLNFSTFNFTLTKNRTYRLKGSFNSVQFNGNEGSIRAYWKNITSGSRIGVNNSQIVRPLDYTTTYAYQFTTETIVAVGNADIVVGMFCDCVNVAQIGGSSVTSEAAWFDIEVIGGNAPVTYGVTGPTGITGCTGPTGPTGPNGPPSPWFIPAADLIYYSAGNVAIGKSSASYTLDIEGNLNVSQSIYATYFVNTSDYRIKENPVLLDASYNVDRLRPLRYRNLLINKDDLGFLAHEVQEVYPFLVEGNKDEEKKQSLNYIGLIAILVKEVQELKKENVALKLAMEEQAASFDTRLQAIESTFFKN